MTPSRVMKVLTISFLISPVLSRACSRPPFEDDGAGSVPDRLVEGNALRAVRERIELDHHGASVREPSFRMLHQRATDPVATMRLEHTERVHFAAHLTERSDDLIPGRVQRLEQPGLDLPDDPSVLFGDEADPGSTRGCEV